MTAITQSELEHLQERIRRGEVEHANVELVRIQRVRLVQGRLPASVRKELNDAVKRGDLGHMKKTGHKPEAYFMPEFEYLAKAQRASREAAIKRASLAVMARVRPGIDC